MPKQYDQSFKLLTEEAPREALALFAGIPLSVKMEVEPLDRELNLSTLHVDNVYRCRDRKEEFLVHLEAVARFKPSALERQFDYVQALVAKYDLPCRSYIVLLSPKAVPLHLPGALHRNRGDLRQRLRLRIVRLWHIPAADLLALNNANILPWTPLTDASRDQLDLAALRLRQSGKPDLTGRLFFLGGLRYGSREAFLQRFNHMILSEEIMNESSTYRWLKETASKEGLKEGLEKGLQKGLQKGLRQGMKQGLEQGLEQGLQKGIKQGLQQGIEQGREAALRDAVIQALTIRFGALSAARRARIANVKLPRLERLLHKALSAPTLSEALK